MTQNTIEYENVSKHFGDVVAVDDVSFEVRESELLALLGPSGSGKTTTLRLLAGFETPTSGTIRLSEQDITQIPPHKRDTGMVFQDYALFPHMTVGENIAFGMKRQKFPKADIQERIEEVLEMVDLAGYQDRKPDQLSGGQQQRVATARALAIQPTVLLMDEPLGALDKKLRDQLQVELRRIQDQLEITTLYVTHNQSEALTIADRIAVMNDGQIEQIASPTAIYEEPATEFVANFIGDTNFLRGSLIEQNGDVFLRMSEADVKVNAGEVPDYENAVFIRPEKISVVRPDRGDGHENVISGRVEQRLFLGSKMRYYVNVGDETIIAEMENTGRESHFTAGDDVELVWNGRDTQVVKA